MTDLLSKLKALSDGNRLRVVAVLMEQDELCACQIIELLQITGATVSRHLSLLVTSGILNSRKEGRWVYYRLDKTDALLIEWLESNIKGSANFAEDCKKLKKITASEPEDICRKQRGNAFCR